MGLHVKGSTYNNTSFTQQMSIKCLSGPRLGAQYILLEKNKQKGKTTTYIRKVVSLVYQTSPTQMNVHGYKK